MGRLGTVSVGGAVGVVKVSPAKRRALVVARAATGSVTATVLAATGWATTAELAGLTARASASRWTAVTGWAIGAAEAAVVAAAAAAGAGATGAGAGARAVVGARAVAIVA